MGVTGTVGKTVDLRVSLESVNLSGDNTNKPLNFSVFLICTLGIKIPFCRVISKGANEVFVKILCKYKPVLLPTPT